MKWYRRGCLVLSLGFVAASAQAGGAWVPERAEGDFHFGYSVKTADASWNPRGDTRITPSWHIFRYLYAGGEVGLGNRFSAKFLTLWLDGLEGPRGDMEHNAGFSELFLGLKYQLKDGKWPMALHFNHRTSYLYDLQGEYDRHLFTETGEFNGVSPEWRGLLGEDYGLNFLLSRSMFEGRGWMNLEVGYNYRTGNLSDEMPIYYEIAAPLPWKSLIAKGSYRYVQSISNHSEARDFDDRFGCSVNNCFPDASMMAVGGSLFRDFGADKKWWGEAGFNQWIWGRSARKYQEPYLTVGRRF